MKLNLDQPSIVNIIRSVTTNGLMIGDQRYHSSLILTPGTVQLWSVSQVCQLTPDHFVELSQQPVETIILGTGKRGVFIDATIYHPLINKGIGLEMMSTAAACRTWNVLAGDGRKVMAALIIESA